jgi:ketosteroid isomerase-like protein
MENTLPKTIVRYLEARAARDADAALACCTDDVLVSDDGHTYRGRAAVGGWLTNAATEYSYTSELTAVTREDDNHVDALHHLEGDFPGGVADLHYRFTLRNGLIAELAIAA